MEAELNQVEYPFIAQLQQLGWDYLEGDTDVPHLTERESFRQVLLTTPASAPRRRRCTSSARSNAA